MLGYLPLHVRQMSLWDYAAALSGYNNSVRPPKADKSPTVDKLNAQIAESMAREAKQKALKQEE